MREWLSSRLLGYSATSVTNLTFTTRTTALSRPPQNLPLHPRTELRGPPGGPTDLTAPTVKVFQAILDTCDVCLSFASLSLAVFGHATEECEYDVVGTVWHWTRLTLFRDLVPKPHTTTMTEFVCPNVYSLSHSIISPSLPSQLQTYWENYVAPISERVCGWRQAAADDSLLENLSVFILQQFYYYRNQSGVSSCFSLCIYTT